MSDFIASEFVKACIMIFAITLASFGILLLSWFAVNKFPQDKQYTVTCGIITPNGPQPTIKMQGTNVEITDFGIIRMKEGLYVPTTNEVCIVENEK